MEGPDKLRVSLFQTDEIRPLAHLVAANRSSTLTFLLLFSFLFVVFFFLLLLLLLLLLLSFIMADGYLRAPDARKIYFLKDVDLVDLPSIEVEVREKKKKKNKKEG